MNARVAAPAGWLIAAAFFAVVLGSIVHVDFVGRVPQIALLAIAVLCAVKPQAGLPLVAATVPLAWYTAAQFWNPKVSWAEAVACAGIAGLSIAAARPRRSSLPVRLAAPAVIFGALVVVAMLAALGVMRERLGPAFTDAIVTHFTQEHFTDLRGFPAVHAGMLLLEGVLLFSLAARAAAQSENVLRNVARAVAVGGGLAAVVNIGHLGAVAMRREQFWSAVGELTRSYRWNVAYGDYNAAGSYFVMVLLVAIALWWSERRLRALWAGCVATIAVAFWLTGSRAALLAGLLASVAVVLLLRLSRAPVRRRIFAAAAIASAAVLLLVGVAAILPQRGDQHSALQATDVRIGLARTSFRMIATHPLFGIGLGEFYQRSGEPAFTDAELLAAFPVAVHENAHDNFLQVAAELGAPGGLLFVWLVGVALATILLRAVATREPRWALTTAAAGAFVITWLAGHPLLVPEAAFAFWILVGASAGAALPAAQQPGASSRRAKILTALACGAVVLLLPWRMQALTREAEFEHVCIGCSPWQFSLDGIRHREAEGHATLFVPGDTAFEVSVNPRTGRPVQLELRLDGRVANVVMLAPRRWNDVRIPMRTERTGQRYARLDVRVVDDDKVLLWITKVQPIG
jgi:O-antigen ligase